MSATKRWIITTDSSQPLSDVSTALTETGFVVEQVLTEIGCITGTATDAVARKLSAITGVADVSPDSDIGIGPPDGPTTW